MDDNILTPDEEKCSEEIGKKFIEKYGGKFDIVSILYDGKMPEFSNNIERVVCTYNVAHFIRNRYKTPEEIYTGFQFIANNLSAFLKLLDKDHLVIFSKQQSLFMMEALSHREEFKWLIIKMMKIAT